MSVKVGVDDVLRRLGRPRTPIEMTPLSPTLRGDGREQMRHPRRAEVRGVRWSGAIRMRPHSMAGLSSGRRGDEVEFDGHRGRRYAAAGCRDELAHGDSQPNLLRQDRRRDARRRDRRTICLSLAGSVTF